MRAMVVYESMFGNTEQVAKAVADGLAPNAEVDVVNIDDVGSVAEADLLVVGGPTHVHGMSWPSSRTEAGRQAVEGVRSTKSLRDWVGTLDGVSGGNPVATFDTRIGQPRWLTGSAAMSVARKLRRLGFVPLAPSESFLVRTDKQEPVLRDGELARARDWGALLGKEFARLEKA
ncbi:flavodoxin family protein [Amycolatopsis sp. lyj-112]|uniref:flavodoxin family protein n=1 Tax=Amycolatopsis sp. lyj-112 TaxID=2789288 RepID=UPI00397DBD41